MSKRQPWIDIFAFATACAWSFGQLGRISFLHQEINGYAYELLLVPLMLLMMVRYRHTPIEWAYGFMKSWYALPLYLLFAFIPGMQLYSAGSNITALLYSARLILYILTAIYLGYHWRKGPSPYLARGLWIATAITIITSILQYVFYNDLVKLYFEGWDPHLYRMVGVFLDPPIAAAAYGLLFMFVMAQRTLNPRIRALTLVLLGIGCTLTYSRGAYAAILVCLAVYIVRQRKLLIGAVIMAVFVISLLLLPKQISEGANLVRSSSIMSRILDDREGFAVWATHPLIGVGYNRIRDVKQFGRELSPNNTTYSHAGASFHSSFLIMLATGGLIGLGLFIWFLLSIGRINDQLMYSILFLSVMSLSDNVVLHPFMLFFVLITAAQYMGPYTKMTVNNLSGTSR